MFVHKSDVPSSHTQHTEEVTVGVDLLEVMGIITNLEHMASTGDWVDGMCGDTDLKMMPFLVEEVNNRNPGLNLTFLSSPEELTKCIKNDVESPVTAARFITNVGGIGVHFAVIDYRLIDGNRSFLLFDSVSPDSVGMVLLMDDTQIAINTADIPDCFFSAVAMDIQRSPSGCGVFSLAISKKLYQEASAIERMHRANIARTLGNWYGLVLSSEADEYLPATFYKHAQSSGRINEYLERNPNAEEALVNKKSQTLVERYRDNVRSVAGRSISHTIWERRISNYRDLLEERRPTSTGEGNGANDKAADA